MENNTSTEVTSTVSSAPADSRCRVNTTSSPLPGIVESGVTGIQMSANGLIVNREDLTAEDYNAVFRTALSIHKSSCWLLGDVLLLGERHWGNRHTASKYDEAMQATGLSRSTLRDIVMTCKKFPVEKRHASLSFTHHQEIARTDADPDQREEVLQKAADEKLTCSALRKQLHQTSFTPQPEVDLSRPPVGEEPDRTDLLGLPERVNPDAPPMWDAIKFRKWVEKQEPETYTAEQCEQAVELTEDIADFYNRVLQRQQELDGLEAS